MQSSLRQAGSFLLSPQACSNTGTTTVKTDLRRRETKQLRCLDLLLISRRVVLLFCYCRQVLANCVLNFHLFGSRQM